MVTDQQVLLLRRRIMEAKTQQASAAAAGMSARSARRWRSGNVAVGEEEAQLANLAARTRSRRCGR